MNSTISKLVIGFAASTALATAAQAQRDYGTVSTQTKQPQPQLPDQAQEKPAKGGATVTIGTRKTKISAEFAKAYNDLLAAVNAKDAATIPGKVAAAHAAAKSGDEHYLASQLQLKAAAETNNEAEIGTALEGMLASDALPADQVSRAYLSLGKVRYNQKQFAQAAAAFEKVVAAEPNNQEALSLLASSQSLAGNSAGALALLQKAIAAASAGGAKAPEDLYKRAVSLAYKANSPASVELSREWVSKYPSAQNWSDAIRIYRNINKVDDTTTLDLLRLARAVDALKGEEDYDRYAYAALTKGYPGEAKTILEEGIKAGAVDPKKTPFKEEIAMANQKSAGEAATLESAAKTALAASTAKPALSTGDLLYGYGQYAKAAELYRAALKKTGADASLINLHLGMALARSGDKAGATAALSAVTGARADVAKYWLAYLATQA